MSYSAEVLRNGVISLSELLRLQERIALAISLGESHFREFKSALEGPINARRPRVTNDICDDIATTLVAFANADGGELIVGVEDNGELSGVPHSPAHVEKMLAAPHGRVHASTPLPSPRTLSIDYKGQTILYFAVPKGTEHVHHTSQGRCLQRKDRGSLSIASESVVVSRAEQASREYDRHFVDGATVDNLDLPLVREVGSQISKGMTAEKCLQHLELAEFDGNSLRLRRAALLLFAKEASRWHPRSQVRLLKVDGTELKSGKDYNVTVDEHVRDNVLTLIESAWDLIRPHLTETRFASDAVFRTQIIYPEAACREALINAIAHRDYSIEGRGIEVHVYEDRLTIVSPGGLLSSIRIEDLKNQKGVHQSRNSFVARVLREVGYMRELGEGIRRIHELMTSNDLTPPELRAEPDGFSISLQHRHLYSDEEKLWLEQFALLKLDREQKTVVRLGYNGHVVSAKEIWEAVGIIDTDAYRRLIESLMRRGVLKAKVTRLQVQNFAIKHNIPRKSVPRYVVEARSEALAAAGKEISRRKRLVEGTMDKDDYSRVYVGNIPFEITQEELTEVFDRYGTVVDVFIPIDATTRRNKGFAFLEFDTRASAHRALVGSGEVCIGGRSVYVKRATPRDAT